MEICRGMCLMITAKYILDNIGESTASLFPNEAIDVTYDELKLGKPVINYISLDGMGIDLYDDTSEFVEDEDYCGYISEDVSGENCVSTDRISFFGQLLDDVTSAENNLEITNGITINFEKDFVKEIKIVAYDKDDNKVYENIFEISGLNNFIETGSFFCNRMYVYFTKTNTPNSFVKINTFAIGEIHTIDSFFDFDLQDEKNILSSDLPMGQVKFSTISEKDLIGKEGNTLILYDDTQLLGRYYLKSVDKTSNTKYSFTIQNILYKLDKKLYSNKFAFEDSIWKYEAVNAYDELVKLFDFVEVDYYIDESLKNVWLSPYMETDKSARYVLQQICFASGAYVDCWLTDKIKVLTYKPKTIIKTIRNSNNVIFETKIKSSVYSNINWKIKYYDKQTKDTTEQHIATIPASSTDSVRYNFDKDLAVTDIGTAMGNFTIGELTPKYIVLLPKDDVLVDVLGYYIAQTEISKKLFFRNFGDEVVLDKYNLVGFKTNTLNIEDNENIKTLDSINEYYTKFSGKTLSAKIVYNGEKTGDFISIQTNDNSMFSGIITSLSFDNSSNYRTAKIEVMEWNI